MVGLDATAITNDPSKTVVPLSAPGVHPSNVAGSWVSSLRAVPCFWDHDEPDANLWSAHNLHRVEVED